MKGGKDKDKQLPSQLPHIPELSMQKGQFWQYNQPSQQEIELIHNYLWNNQQLIFQLQFPNPVQTINEAFIIIANLLQIQPHFIMTQVKGIQTQLGGENQIESNIIQPPPPDQSSPQQQLQYLIFHNIQIDVVTLKILNFVWQMFPNLQVLKIFNCILSKDEMNELCNLVLQNKITKLFVEFIQTDESNIKLLLETIPKSQQLLQLFLRGNKLQCKDITIFFDVLEQNNSSSNLKFLELTSNNIGRQGISSLANYLKKQNKLEYIGLAKNNINSWDDIKELCDLVVKKKLTQEELQSYRDLEVQREAQIKAALKPKKKTTEEVPIIQLDPIIQNSDGSYSMILNGQLKVLNFAMNNLSEQDKDLVDKFMNQSPENLQLILISNNFESKTKEKLKKKYKNIIF